MRFRKCAGYLSLVFAAAVASQTALAVQAVWLTDSEITQHFSNATIDGRYASGRPFTERYDRDGRLTYSEFGVTMTGHWSATEGTLCTIYQLDASGGCYRVARVDTNCFEFYFVSRTEQAAPGLPGEKPRWTARGAIQGQPSACRDAPSV